MGLTSFRSATAKHKVVDVELFGGVHLLEQVQVAAPCGTFCNLSVELNDREARGSQKILIEREKWGQARGMGWGREEDETYLQEVQGDGVILLGCHLHQPLQVLQVVAR